LAVAAAADADLTAGYAAAPGSQGWPAAAAGGWPRRWRILRGRAARQTMSRAVFHARRRPALLSGGPARPPAQPW